MRSVPPHLAVRDLSLEAFRGLLRQANVDVTLRYARLSPTMMRGASKRLDIGFGAGSRVASPGR